MGWDDVLPYFIKAENQEYYNAIGDQKTDYYATANGNENNWETTVNEENSNWEGVINEQNEITVAENNWNAENADATLDADGHKNNWEEAEYQNVENEYCVFLDNRTSA